MLYNWHIGLRDRSDPLHCHTVKAIIDDIENGRLAPGAWMRSSRYLAETLGFNRKTVMFVHEHLISPGWLTGLGTRSAVVAAALPRVPATPSPPDSGSRGVGYSFRKHRRGRAAFRLASAALRISLELPEKVQG